jgi:predicted extracellular nuclease
MLKNTKLTLIVLILFIHNYKILAQKENPIGLISFYNVENLFDTVDDPTIKDEEYLPKGRNKWDETRYQEKLKNISKVISSIGNGPDIVGLCEIENRKVLEDLVQTPLLKNKRYQITHFDSPDFRGIDVALIYKTGIFKPFDTKIIPFSVVGNSDYKTREMLWVKGLYNKDTLNIVVCHWPSRRGGKEDKRILAAQSLRKVLDSVQQVNPKAKIILMGDFNDDPRNKSIKNELKAGGKVEKLVQGDLYNTSTSTFKKGFGTISYRGNWNLFDQIIISQSLLKQNSQSYYYIPNSFSPFGPDWMRVKDGEYAGSPKRTFSRGVYQNGFSDHFPSFILIGKK